MAAAYHGHLGIVIALIQAKAEVNAKANNGSTALILATLRGHFDTVRALIKANAEVNVVHPHDGFTALMWAVLHGSIPCVQLLLQAGANPIHKNNIGQTAYRLARQLEGNDIREEILRLLNEPIAQ
jgi:ankyrin repeat protein